MWRLRLTQLFYLLAAVLILSKLFYLQILQRPKFQVLAEKQHWLLREIPGERGEIFSSDGHPLVTNENAYLLFAVPPEISNVEDVVDKLLDKLVTSQVQFFILNEVFSLDKDLPEEELQDKIKEYREKVKEGLISLLKEKERLFVPIAHKISLKLKDEITGFKIKGIYFEEEEKRSYPEGSLAAHVLGFVGKDENNTDVGYFGVEGHYNADLTAAAGFRALEKDALGKPIPFGQTLSVPPQEGRSLVLTINRELQYFLEKKLTQGIQRYQAEGGTAILLQPQTGKIWALASFPTFNPENWVSELRGESDVAKVEAFRNQGIAVNYEPGSVFKIVTMAAALETNTVKPTTIYDDQGAVQYSGHWVRTWDNKYHGKIDMAQILQLSDNTGAAWVGTQLGFDRFWSFLQKFHLGQTFDVGLEGEDAGIVRSRTQWRDIDLANMSFGQGIAVTPLQVAMFVSAVANDGILMKPKIVDKILDDDKEIILPNEVLSRPISPQTANTLKGMLKSVIEKGEFKWFIKNAGLERFNFAGKTGTAQIPVNGRYDPSQTNVTFVGFAPHDKPKFVLLVKLTKPKSSTYSADTAVPLWLEIARELFVYFNIGPEE